MGFLTFYHIASIHVNWEITGDPLVSLCICSKHPEFNRRLAKFTRAKKLLENLIVSKDAFSSEEALNKEWEQMNETGQQLKQHLVDTNRNLHRGISGISVHIYPEKTK